ncbi:MAG: hypothetical protein WEF53_02055 [Bacteroidota bacterium]
MPDNILLIVFGTLSALSLIAGGFAFSMAVKYAKKPDGELKMAIWAILGMAGLVFAGVSWAYFLIPIFINRIF